MESSVAVKMTFTSAPMLGSKRCALQVGLDALTPSRPRGQDASRPRERWGHGPASHSFPMKCAVGTSTQRSNTNVYRFPGRQVGRARSSNCCGVAYSGRGPERIAANVAKLPDLLRTPPTEP
jgi:hypothetical protein